MAITRRHLLSVAAGMPGALAQVAEDSFAIVSDSGLRMERHGDPQRPAVALFLPKAKDPSVVIEMPEHAWRKEKANSEQKWFYRMYTSDRTLQGEVSWSKNENRLSFSMKTPSGFILNSTARLEPNGIAVSHEVISGSVLQLAAVEATTCVKLYRPFTDVFLERTWVHDSEGLELFASETADRLRKNVEEWLPCRYIAQVAGNAAPAAHRVEQLEGITRHFRSRPVDRAFLATESLPGGWTIATHAVNCDSVFTNPARTCHHTDPRAIAITDGRAVLRLKVYALKGTARDAWSLVAKRERASQA